MSIGAQCLCSAVYIDTEVCRQSVVHHLSPSPSSSKAPTEGEIADSHMYINICGSKKKALIGLYLVCALPVLGDSHHLPVAQ